MPAPPKRHCKRGHDTHETGRDTNGYCRACRRAGQARWRKEGSNRLPATAVLDRLPALVDAYGSAPALSRAVGKTDTYIGDLMKGRIKTVPFTLPERLDKARLTRPVPSALLQSLFDSAVKRYASSYEAGGSHAGKHSAQIGMSGVLRAYAERFGVDIRTAARHYAAVRKELVPLEIADRWATFLGTHIDLLRDTELV